MATKRKTGINTPAATDRDQSRAVYSRIHHVERDMGTTRNFSKTTAPSNARPLEAFVQTESVVESTHYDYRTGQMVTKKKDIVRKAQSHIATLELRHPVTAGLRKKRQEEDARREFGSSASNVCLNSPWAPRHHPESPVPDAPLSGGMKRKRSY